ncbi:MAG: hypothetical protein ABEJ70_00400 [Halobacteriaceae archaeon]
MSRADLPYLLPRVAIAAVFVGFGVWELFDPAYWAAYVPRAVATLPWTLRLVQVHGLLLTTTAVALLLPAFETAGAAAATLLLAEICVDVLVSNGVDGVFLRDVGLLLVALGLVWLPYTDAAARGETD